MADHKTFKKRDESIQKNDRREDVQVPAEVRNHRRAFLEIVGAFEVL